MNNRKKKPRFEKVFAPYNSVHQTKIYELCDILQNTVIKNIKYKNQDPQKAIEKIDEAIIFANHHHKTTSPRGNGEPYITHPLEVAIICVKDMKLGVTAAIAALLHDVVEDTEENKQVTINDIETAFGKRVAKTVFGLTKPDKINEDTTTTEKNQETEKHLILATKDEPLVILIKLADRLHNMRTIEGKKNKVSEKNTTIQTLHFYTKIADRLGFRNIKNELENYCFKCDNLENHQEILNYIDKTRKSRDLFVSQFGEAVKKNVAEKGIDCTIIPRLKSFYSIHQKMKGRACPIEDMDDLFAIRIIVATPFEKEKATLKETGDIIEKYYEVRPKQFKNYCQRPKSNGYEAIHSTIKYNQEWVDIQITSTRLNEIAEVGLSAHWKYKEKNQISSNGLDSFFSDLNQLSKIKDTDEFADHFDTKCLYPEEVKVYTPNREVFILPKGSTILDFAFALSNPKIGRECSSAKVNGKLMPISYILNDDDTVKIILTKNSKPKIEWLDLVKSLQAKNLINAFVADDVKHLKHKGQKILNAELQKLNITLDNDWVNAIRERFNINSISELFQKIGRERIDREKLAKFIQLKQGSFKNNKIIPGKGNVFVLAKHKEEEDFTFAGCCNPIFGDNVYGYQSVNEGLEIHKRSCHNEEQGKSIKRYGKNSLVDVSWEGYKKEIFRTTIKISGQDRVGLILDLVKIITSKHDINIKKMEINAENSEQFKGEVQLYVIDKEQLDKLIKSLKALDNVRRVVREDS